MALVGSDLYVGGRFTQTGDGTVTNLGRVARYDTSVDTWHPLSNQGLSEEVTALAVVGSDLYVGGTFTQTVDGAVVDMGNVARYNTTAGTWHALPNDGLNGPVFAMAVVGSDLYVGGTFTQSGDGSLTNLNRIARYDTANPGWHALLNDGLNGSVYALAVDGSDLYAGGAFTQPGDWSATNLNHVARYDTTNPGWHALSNQGLNNQVNALMVSGSDLYVGGWFAQTGDGAVTNLDHVARYDATGGTWHGLSNQGLNTGVSALTMVSNTLYVGGQFTQTGDGAVTNLGYIALYDTTAATWEALPNQGLNNWVYVMAAVGSDLYVGGEFSQTADGSVSGLNRIARLGPLGHKVYLPLVLRS
jgi:N-acetylneuraminic acid mutarotase